MEIFKEYANLYDLIYSEKDYKKEVFYIDKLIQTATPGANSILEFGCGTGKHSRYLSELGYKMIGVDISPEMIQRATMESLTSTSKRIKNNKYVLGNIKEVKFKKKFDCVLSLFHVISYIESTSDLEKTFGNAHEHLNDRGLFVFDCWFGPAVLSDPPKDRINKYENNENIVYRIVTPEIDFINNVVSVNIEIIHFDRKTNRINEFNEIHKMRYLFDPEIESLFKKFGFKLVRREEMLTGNIPNRHTWSVCYVAKKNECQK